MRNLGIKIEPVFQGSISPLSPLGGYACSRPVRVQKPLSFLCGYLLMVKGQGYHISKEEDQRLLNKPPSLLFSPKQCPSFHIEIDSRIRYFQNFCCFTPVNLLPPGSRDGPICYMLIFGHDIGSLSLNVSYILYVQFFCIITLSRCQHYTRYQQY